MPLLRRSKVPQVVRDVALDPGERRLAWGVTDDGAAVLATTTGLRLPGGEALVWGEVERAVWQRPVLEVVQVSELEGSGPRTRVVLAQEHDLADAVRSSVTGSVAWSAVVKLGGGAAVRVVGRRRPGRDDLQWQLVFQPGTDPQDPDVRARAEAALLDARRTLG